MSYVFLSSQSTICLVFLFFLLVLICSRVIVFSNESCLLMTDPKYNGIRLVISDPSVWCNLKEGPRADVSSGTDRAIGPRKPPKCHVVTLGLKLFGHILGYLLINRLCIVS